MTPSVLGLLCCVVPIAAGLESPDLAPRVGQPPCAVAWHLPLDVSALAPAATPGSPKDLFHFHKDDVGKFPNGWTALKTGKGEGSVWRIAADETAPSTSGCVLAQTAEAPKGVFNVCVASKLDARNVGLSVAFKAVKGKLDQGGGLVWRLQDADNYYVARYNPLEDNLRVYKVIAGKRIQLATKEGVKLPAGKWHTMTIVNVGDQIRCTLVTEQGKLGRQ